MSAVAGLNVDEADAGNYTGHVVVQLSLPSSAFSKTKTPVYWEPAADGPYKLAECFNCILFAVYLFDDADSLCPSSNHV